jgi:hypothetical protein
MSVEITQLFFGKEEGEQALAAAKAHHEDLFEIIDRRSKAPKPLMFVLTRAALNQMYRAKMMKRMWIDRQHVWRLPLYKEPKDEGYIGRGPEK